MAPSKKLVENVAFLDSDSKLHQFFAGDTLPGDLVKYVTNTDLFSSDAPASTDAGAGQPNAAEKTAALMSLKGAELQELARAAELDPSGKKADVVARLLAHEAKLAAEAAAKDVEDEDTEEEGELDSLTRDELVTKAGAAGITVEDEATSAEIVALIEAAQAGA